MNDHLYRRAVYALIVAVACGAALTVVNAEIDLAQTPVQAAAAPAAPVYR